MDDLMLLVSGEESSIKPEHLVHLQSRLYALPDQRFDVRIATEQPPEDSEASPEVDSVSIWYSTPGWSKKPVAAKVVTELYKFAEEHWSNQEQGPVPIFASLVLDKGDYGETEEIIELWGPDEQGVGRTPKSNTERFQDKPRQSG